MADDQDASDHATAGSGATSDDATVDSKAASDDATVDSEAASDDANDDSEAAGDGRDDADTDRIEESGAGIDLGGSGSGSGDPFEDPFADLGGETEGLVDPTDAVEDPRQHVPTPEVPSVGVDEPETPGGDDVPEELRAEFWELVFAFNVALFGVAVGVMLVAFDVNASLGGLGIVVGSLAGAYGIWRYRNREHTP